MHNNDMIPGGKWPGAFGVYKYSKKVVTYNLNAFLPLIILGYAADIIANYSNMAVAILLYVMIFLFQISAYTVLISSLHLQKISLAQALDKATRLSLKIIAVYIIILVTVFVGLVALIVPGLILLPRLILAPYYIIDQEMTVKQAIEAAWHNSKEQGLRTWAVIAVQILFGLLAIIIIGIYLSIVYSAALIVLYGFTNGHLKTKK